MKCHNVGNGIFVSDYSYCNFQLSHNYRTYKKWIHIYRGDLRAHDVCYLCNKFLDDGFSEHLVLCYGEGASVDHLAERVYDFSLAKTNEDTLLIHCAAGQTRGPILALIAKIARGNDLVGSIGEITDAFRRDPKQGDFPLFHATPLRSIEKFLRSTREAKS